jgi:hypothetical protein
MAKVKKSRFKKLLPKKKQSKGNFISSKIKKIKKSALNKFLKDSFRYLFMLAVTIAFAVLAFITLPQTERVFPDATFDLVEKEYISKSYILELRIQKKDEAKIDQKIRQTSRIISKRLYKSGAQQVAVTGYRAEEPKADDEQYIYRYIQVKVNASISEEFLDQLVSTRSYLRFYTAKEDAVFDDEENPYAQYMVTNYDPTRLTRHSFRSVFFTEIKDQNGEPVYSALFKNYPFNTDFENFISDNAGKTIGFGVDQFITPIEIPFEYSKEYREAVGQNQFQFSINLTSDKSVAELQSVLFNSGVIPLEYLVSDQTVLETTKQNVSHLSLALTYFAIVVGLALFNIYVVKKDKSKVAINLFSLLMTFALYVGYLKFFLIPVDLSLLYVTSMLFVLVTYINTLKTFDNNDYLIVLLILFITWITSFGLIKELSLSVLTLLTLYVVVKDLIRLYFINMKKFLSND